MSIIARQLFIYASFLLIVATACIVSLMYADYVLQMAKARQVPMLSIGHVDYMHVTRSEVVVGDEESGVSDEAVAE